MKLSLVAAACLALAARPGPAFCQALPVVSTPEAAPTELDQLVAPVALYPDQVLADILAAATYPAEVVEAARFLADPAHAGLDGATLTQEASGKDWDPSVKALLLFPQVLQMMDGNLEWTEHLGRAFIARQADVLAAVQHLRLAAEQAGTLVSTPYESVVNEGDDIEINPPSQQDVYLPSYAPQCVFGPDPACDGLDNQVFWASDIFLPYGYAPWGRLDWAARAIRLERPFRGGTDRFVHQRTGDLGDIWRHSSLRAASLGGSIAGSPGQFNYAPPANVPFARQGVPAPQRFAPRPGNAIPRFAPPARISAAPAFRAAHPVGAFHPAGR